METNNTETISITEVIDFNSYKNEKAHNLTRALLDVATLARSIKFAADHNIRNDGTMSIDNINHWMSEMVEIANNAIRKEMLTEKL